MANEIELENQKQGNPESEWGLANGASSTIEGFTTDISINHGGTVDFKIDTDSTDYRIDIYRLGYYGGDGARKVATIEHQSNSPTIQPSPLKDPSTGLVDAGNWSVTDHWDIPADAVSGVYIAKLVRQDGVEGENQIPFVVRDDGGHSDIVVQTSDSTWEAYNLWGGADLYHDDQGGNRDTRAYAVSYNRPLDPNSVNGVFGTEIASIYWLEKNGYDVSYMASVDTARSGSEILDHKVFISNGHDEYWSAEQRASVEAARDAGVNLMFWSGNEIFWKTRWEPSIDGSGTDYRTVVSYKETPPWATSDIDPSPVWTGAWRDPASPDGSQPENALSGQIFMVDSDPQHPDPYPLNVPYAMSQFRIWANTDVANLQPGQVATLEPVLGYELDAAADNGFRPDGLVPLSSTTLSVKTLLGAYTSVSETAGTATHNLTLYRAPSGALVFGAGSIFWSWGLDSDHLPHEGGPIPPADPNIQQAMVNLLADMGVQPTTLEAGLVFATQSTDHTPPISMITSSSVQSLLGYADIHGTATDFGGGTVAAVEVSTDNGATWHLASGTTDWTYRWNATQGSTSYSILSRALDDSINFEPSGSPTHLAVVSAPRLDEFSWDQGWKNAGYSRHLVDLNHDGKLDYLGFGSHSTYVAYGGAWADDNGNVGNGFGEFDSVFNDFGITQGFKTQRGAVETGYGSGASIYAQGNSGIYWKGAQGVLQQQDGSGATVDMLQYETSSHFYAQFGAKQGWNSHYGFDITFASPTQQYASILGFGYKGVVVAPEAFAPDAQASQSYTIKLPVGNGNGWDQLKDVRTFTDANGDAIDLNHDGIVDFFGIGPKGTAFAYGSMDSAGNYTLGTLQTAHISGTASNFGRAQGWTSPAYDREIVKDLHTGYYDIIAFGQNGVYVAMGQDPTTHGGEPFGAKYLAMSGMGVSDGWSTSKTPRIIADVNNDGVVDIVGFGSSKTFIALGSIDHASGNLSFTLHPELTIDNLGYKLGWDSATTMRAVIENVDGHGHSALALSGAHGTDVWDLLA